MVFSLIRLLAEKQKEGVFEEGPGPRAHRHRGCPTEHCSAIALAAHLQEIVPTLYPVSPCAASVRRNDERAVYTSGAPLPVSGCGDARVAPPCPTTLCVWRNLPYLTLCVRGVVLARWFPTTEGLPDGHLRCLGQTAVLSRAEARAMLSRVLGRPARHD